MQMTDLTTGHTLYVVGYAHLDSQWRWSYPQTIREFIYNTLVDNFALFEQYPDYIFNFSGSRRYAMMKEYYPAEYERLKDYIAQGRWFPCGSSVDECDVNVPSPESLIRQVLYGNRYFRDEFGVTSDEFILPDCFGFPAAMPNTLAHCGIRGFSSQKLTWGSAVGIPFNVGVWEGLDGKSVVLAAFNPGSYGGRIGEDLSENAEWLERIEQNGKTSGVYADYHYYGTGDVGGAPSVGSAEWLEKSIAGTGPVKVVSSTAEQLFNDVPDAAIPNLPRYKGDLLLTEHSAGSITSQAYMKRWNRLNELLAGGAELASIGAQALAGQPYPTAKLRNAWELTLGSQMHDILPGTCIPEAYTYAWNDEVLAMNQFADVLETSAGSIVGTMDTQMAGQPVAVYNPLSIEREDLVQATLSFPGGAPAALLVAGPDGLPVPVQIIATEGDTLTFLFLAKAPACGFRIYEVLPAEAPESFDTGLAVTESSLENNRYRVEINASGDVASIYDKHLGRELLAAPVRLAFTHDAPGYWPAWNIDWDDQRQPPEGYVDGPAEIEVVEAGPARIALEVRRSARDSRFVQRISLAAGTAGERVEFSDVIDWRGRGCNLKATFELTAVNPEATYNWETGTIRRPTNDEKKYEVPSHQWLDLTDQAGEFGAMVLSPFKYASDKPDDHTLRLTLLRTPGVHSDDYADQASQDWGRHEISYGLAGHAGDWRTGNAYWQAYRLEQPLLAFSCGKHPGFAGRELPLVTVDHPGVRVLATKLAEDSAELIVRLVELDGESKDAVRIGLFQPIAEAREVDGQEYELGPAQVTDGVLVTGFGPYQLRTFALKLAETCAGAAEDSAVLDLPFDTCVATTDGEAAVGGFDGSGRSLPAELLPHMLTDGGVQFSFAPAGDARTNAVACAGQQLGLPTGDYNYLYLIAAASPAAPECAFNFGTGVATLNIQDWGGFIGRWDDRQWHIDPPELAFRWPYTPVSIQAGYIKRDPVAWFSSHRHEPHGRNSIYDYTYLYRYRLAIPAGATAVTLPDNPNVKILAMSVARVADPDFTPAQPLYDTLAGHQDVTELPEIVYEPKE
ncbi:alpha-mannosidase [bacterium]|nr:alpha-mannosidase [bacterium]